MLYSVIVPCYKSSHTIREVVELTIEELRRLGKTPFEFVLVDDASPDGGETLLELHALAQEHGSVRIVELARNAGEEAGLDAAPVAAAILAMADLGLFTLALDARPVAARRTGLAKAQPETGAAWRAICRWREGHWRS